MSNELVEHLKTCRRSHPHENMDSNCSRFSYYEKQLSILRQQLADANASANKWYAQCMMQNSEAEIKLRELKMDKK